MLIKCTMIFSLTTNLSQPQSGEHRTGGWTEGVYYEGPSILDCMLKFHQGNLLNNGNLCGRRAQLLPTGAAITGQRFQILNPIGPSKSLRQIFSGASGIQCDVPQMTLNCSIPGVNVANIRALQIRGIPDARVVEGEYAGSNAFDAALMWYFHALSAFAFRAMDLSLPASPMVSIDANGAISCLLFAPIVNVGDTVLISGTRNSAGKTVKRLVKVATVHNNGEVNTVTPWTHGLCTGGHARKYAIIYPMMDGTNATRGSVTVKKVGRPSRGYVGRRSKKKSA